LTGYPYPNHPIFGVAPCPVCIFTFGLFLWARKRLPVGILVIPLIASIAGIYPHYFGIVCGYRTGDRRNRWVSPCPAKKQEAAGSKDMAILLASI
jgi:hypothetical protein